MFVRITDVTATATVESLINSNNDISIFSDLVTDPDQSRLTMIGV